MRRNALLTVLLALTFPVPSAGQSAGHATEATRLLDRAIDRMGGDSLLRTIQSVRLDVMTQWLRINFVSKPFADAPSYEHNVELRDYAHRAWRNTRMFQGGGPPIPIVDVVRDTVGARLAPVSPSAAAAWAPLNLAYIDERRELFAFAPERLVLHLRDDPAVQVLADTTIDGAPHARLQSVVDGWPATVFLNRADGLPVLVRFRADEVNDFGLAPWGVQEVEFWYSGWARVSPGVLLPRQRDVRRVGKPYKRMTALSMRINDPAPADSFAISPEVEREYLATQQRPMWHVALDTTARIVQDHFATVPPFVGSAGAVHIGGQWVLVETAQHEGAVDLIASWLQQHRPGVPIGAGLATLPAAGNGGARWFAAQRLPLFVSPGAAPVVRTNLARRSAGTTITTARWVRVGTDSLWMEPVAMHDVPGLMAVYSPTLRWLYLAIAGSSAHQAEQDALIASFRARGMPVEWLGSSRQLVSAAP